VIAVALYKILKALLASENCYEILSTALRTAEKDF
jgi:hypothetical protein